MNTRQLRAFILLIATLGMGLSTLLLPVQAAGIISNLSVKDTANAANWSLQANLQVGNTQFGDRAYTLTTVPALVQGADWIRTAMASKSYTGNPTVTFDLTLAATVYLAVDDRLGKLSWMDATWTDSGQNLVNSETSPVTLSLWQKSYAAGSVSLGPTNSTFDFYTIVAVPSGATNTPPPPTNTPTRTNTPLPPTATNTPGGALISNLSVLDTTNAGSWSIQANLQVGNTQFGDRAYTFTTVPALVQGATWIRTANASKSYTGNPIVTFNLSQAVTVYVGLDTRLAEPSWMDASWTNSGQSLVNDETTPRTFNLWQKSYAAGSVSLGPTNSTFDFYTIVVVPSGPTNTPPPPTNTPTKTNTPNGPTATPGGNTFTVDDSVQGAGQNQFNYSGAGWTHCTNCNEPSPAIFYNASQSWDVTTNDSVTFTFTGTQIKYYAVTAPDVGIAAVSIDGGAETNIDLFYTIKTGDVLVWTSATLLETSHTLRIRNTGTKNVSSTGTTITVDRVDYLSSAPPPTATPTPTNTPVPPTVTPCGGSCNSLQSSALKLTVNLNPYSYQVVELSTSTVLASQSVTGFTLSGTRYLTSNASHLSTTATTLDADLTLSGTSTVGHVKFTFTSPQVLQVVLTTKTGTPSEIYEEFNDQGEHYYGVFEYPFAGGNTSLDNRGLDKDFVGQSTSRPNMSNARAPFYMTSRKYGVYVPTEAFGHYKLGVTSKTSFFFDQNQLTYHVLYGPDYASMLSRYNTITGGALMPPTWAFDSQWWRDDCHFDFHNGATNCQTNLMDDATQLQNNHIPASSLMIDRPYGIGTNGWGNFDFDSSFTNPAQLVTDLNAKGLYLTLWIANRAWGGTLYNDGNANGWLFPGISQSTGPALDLRITNAYNYFQNKLTAFSNIGVRGYKIDRGEEGEQPNSAQNQNTTLFAKLAAANMASKFGTDNLIFSRNAVDNSRKYTVIWNGDTYCDFDGLRGSITTGLRSGAINFPMWGSDTGGYISQPAPTEEVFARWLEFSAYSSFMEVNIGNSRTPWYNYTSTLVNIAAAQAAAHHDLIPYSRSYLYKATQTGLPIMRAMLFQFPNDPNLSNLYNLSDQYMYGGEILVAPVTVAGATSRSVYLPSGGKWLDYNNKSTVYTGGQTITASAPEATIPLFVREGAIIPRGDILKTNNNWTPNWAARLRVEIFPSNTSASSFDYYTGSSVQTITATPQSGNLTIQLGNLGNTGDLEVYVQSGFTSVTKNGVTLTQGTDYTYDSAKKLLKILNVTSGSSTTLVINGAVGLF